MGGLRTSTNVQLEGMDKQIGLSDKKTNFDILMSCQSPAQFKRIYEEQFCFGCMQMIGQKNNTDKEIWKKHCLLPEYRGKDGCDRCKMEFWEQEYVDQPNRQ